MNRNPLVAYFLGSVEELRKVTWPTKEQTVRLTIITTVFSLLTAVFLGVLDYGFTFGFQQLLNLFSK